MVQYLEQLLHAKTKDGQSSILYAQWTYDKKIIPSALQAVANLFPHYSLHDESHSVTIINNIVRILGKTNFERLSAIDIWLILEAAYWHDLGMVVSGDELTSAIESPEFLDFVSELMQNKKHSLHDFAIKFEITNGKLRPKENLYNLELSDSIKFILAEFFRWRHADRSKDIVANPLREIHLQSPRGVIPQRIMNLLGDICSSHTKDFMDVMALPFCEVGIDTEDAHPRFIACMLRIGDLLDLDNNRFSEVMLRTLVKIPMDTLQHKAKHLSIKSFRVDRESINIIAQCNNYETANITQHWFNYLNDEISLQMVNWNSIVPNKEMGYLPTIGKLEVDLQGYNQIDGKNKPQFSVDTDKALSLLQGAGIYDGPYQAIREIMQNAVDATLIRIWLEHKDIVNFASPIDDSFLKITRNYPIKVAIRKNGLEDNYVMWQIEIQDNGTGISQSDFEYIMNTGSSSKNNQRKNIINSMPLWMRPSGVFGIGFQSVFMLSDEVTIETKSFFDEQAREVELNSPNSKKDGIVLIKNIKSTHAYKPGTKLRFVHKTKALPDWWSVTIGSRAGDIVTNYDPFSHESMDVEVAKIIDEIYDFSNKCCLPIELDYDSNKQQLATEEILFDYYDNETGLEISINNKTRNENRTFYKGQQVDTNTHNDFDFISFEVNIHNDSASEVLTLSRNKVKSEYRGKLYEDTSFAALRYLIAKYDTFSDENKIAISMFLNTHYDASIINQYELRKYNDWKHCKIIIDNIEVELGGVLSTANKVLLVSYKPVQGVETGDNYSMQDDTLTIRIPGDWGSSLPTIFIIKKIAKEYNGVQMSFEGENSLRILTFYKDNIAEGLLSINYINRILANHSGFGARTTIPCPKDFFDLKIKSDAHTPYLQRYRIDHRIKINFPIMVSPFILKYRRNGYSYKLIESRTDKFYDWVFENRNDSNVTRSEIIKLYDAFCALIDLEKLNKSFKNS